ncbi:hypothetical protein [Variovorax sp. Root434]|uniref:hypothetical protein n=1 Tax=Variovorax sp. Root434 TaxID=1736536 RepID=UPI0006F9CA6A|nr:hypothetical protein [Variovorax sp. Root434]KQX26546.1 hypothetical protein ASD05_28695 [Variovorax sp. Root434]
MQIGVPALPALGLAPRFPAIKSYLKAYFLNFDNWQDEELARLRRYAQEGAGFPYASAKDGYDYRFAQRDLDRCAWSIRWHAIQMALDTSGGKKKKAKTPPRDAAAAVAYFQYLVDKGHPVHGQKHMMLALRSCFEDHPETSMTDPAYAAKLDGEVSEAEYRIVRHMLLEGYAAPDIRTAMLGHAPFLAARKSSGGKAYVLETVTRADADPQLHEWRAEQAAATEGADAFRASLSGDWQRAWRQSVAYEYWSCRMAEHGDLPLLLDTVCCATANCIALGWTDWALKLAGAARQRLETGAFEDYDAGKRPFSQRRLQYFVLRLVESWQGWPAAKFPLQAFDEPLYEALLATWREPDPARIAPLLLAACDRHTHVARLSSSSQVPDLDSRRFWYDPFEIHLVLTLRGLHGLGNPVLQHPLLETPLGAVAEPAPLYTDELLEGVLARTGEEFPGL